ncbi:MAG TPA: 4-(cytidine 5'-diphospho)-2-C-methyl-D-erythritol kinase [Candidatus Dormibacteraeota bacterium]
MILALPARAKLNLSLAVNGLRPDGYHEVDTVLQAVDLHDLLEAEPAESSSLEVTGEAPAGAENLVMKALAALEQAAGRALPTRFRLHKRIPAGAGLGGGSSDAAAALRLASRLHSVALDPALAGQLGADVPFFLCGGAARAGGRGELLQPCRSGGPWFAIAWPGIAVDTAEVYRAWDAVGGEGPNQLTKAAFRVAPQLAEFAQRLGPDWRMTGSGSAFFTARATVAAAEADRQAAPGECWTALTRAVGAWC